MKAITYAKKYENNLLCDCEVNTVRCVNDADCENNIEIIKYNSDKYTLIGTVDLDADDAIRQAVIVFNCVLTQFYGSGIALYIAENSNEASVGIARRNFVSFAEIKTSEDFKTLVSNFFADMKISVDYVSDRKIILTKR